MPTGNGGITQGLALRLTNMEQGRREVTANQFRREQMDALNEQRKAAADYRKALAEQKEAARQEKQISELEKTINVKGLHPIYQDVARKDSAEFISRTIEGMKKVPNYTSSGEYLQDMEKVMAHQNLRLASSNNIFAGEKKVTQNADDYELQSDMYDAMQGLDYNAFIKANGGSDYVMADGNIQPKFNRAKVAEAMIKGSTEGEPIIDVPSEVGGFIRLQQKQPPNPEKLQALRDSYMGIISNSGMNNKDFIKQAQQIDEVYQSVKKSENVIGEKVYKKNSGDDLGMYKAKLKAKADFNAAERAAKEADKAKGKVTTNGNKTTYEHTNYSVEDIRGENGNIILYKPKTGAMPSYDLPTGATYENGKKIKGKVTPSQMHVMDDGNLILIGTVKTEVGGAEKELTNVEVVMPKTKDEGTKIGMAIKNMTNGSVHVFYDAKSGKWKHEIDADIVAPKIAVDKVNANSPKNSAPAGGGTQPTNTQAAPASNLRADGTVKGKGYFGELKMQDGSNKVATEITIGVQFDGKETEIPTLVPTLTNAEKNWLLKGNNPNDKSEIGNSIVNKAIDHAVDRRKRGLSPFKDGGGQKKAAPKKGKATKPFNNSLNIQ